jgi:hypothetical protein
MDQPLELPEFPPTIQTEVNRRGGRSDDLGVNANGCFCVE